MRIPHFFLLLTIAFACRTVVQQPTPAPPPATPDATSATVANSGGLAGKYSFEITIDGQPTTGVINITSGVSAYEGTIATNGFPTVKINAVRVTDAGMMISALTSEGPLEIRWHAEGEQWIGDWTMGQRHGGIRGRLAAP